MDTRFALIAALVLPASASAIQPQFGVSIGLDSRATETIWDRFFVSVQSNLDINRKRDPWETGFFWQGGAHLEGRLSWTAKPSLAVGGMAGVGTQMCSGITHGGIANASVVFDRKHLAFRMGATGHTFFKQLRVTATVGPETYASASLGHITDLNIASGCAVAGRPVRDEAGRIVMPCSQGADREWLRIAHEEHAAVASFVVLAQQLEALGAPRGLVGRVWLAAAEEAEHALAAYVRAGTTRIHALRLPHRPIGDRKATLRRIAREAEVDGVINEGASLKDVLALRDHTSDDGLARHLDRVAGEEQGHVRLNEDILRWARRAA